MNKFLISFNAVILNNSGVLSITSLLNAGNKLSGLKITGPLGNLVFCYCRF